MLSPEQRSLRASVAAYSRWAREDPGPALSKVREGFYARFERQVDPEGILPEPERRRRATAAMRAHMQRMALASSKARRKAAS